MRTQKVYRFTFAALETKWLNIESFKLTIFYMKILLTIVLFGLPVLALNAQTETWSSTTSSDWRTAANWGGTFPTTGDTANFSATTGLQTTVNVGANTSIAALTFAASAPAYTLTTSPGAVLTITATGTTDAIVQGSAGTTETINGAVTLSGAAPAFNLQGDLVFGTSSTLAITGSSTPSVDSASNGGNLFIDGAFSMRSGDTFVWNAPSGILYYNPTSQSVPGGFLRSTSANSVIYLQTAFAGTGLVIGNTGALGGTIYLNANGINNTGTIQMNAAQAVAAGTYTYVFGANASGTASMTQSGNISLNSPTTGVFFIDQFDVAANNTLNINGVISGTATSTTLLKTGSGTLVLGNSNTYAGKVTVSAGTISASNISGTNNNLGNSTSAVVLGGTSTAGTLSYTGNDATYTRGFTIGAGGGEVDTTTAGETLTISTNNIVNTSNGLFTVGGDGNTTITSVIGGGSGGLTKTDSVGTLTLSGSNTYSGGTTVSAGSLYVNNTSGSGTGSGSVQVNSAGILAGSGTISGAVAVATGGALASGKSQTSYAVSNSGNGTVNGTGTGGGLTLNSTLSVAGGASLTFALGSNVDGDGGFSVTNANTDSTYLTVGGSADIFSNTTTMDNIYLTDLTYGAPTGSPTLTLRYQGAYLLIAGNTADFSNLWTTGGEGANGYVLGVSDGTATGYTPFALSITDSNGIPIGSSTNYQGLQLYLYNGDLEVIPEPGTWALMLGGLAALVFWQRRRNKSA